MNDQQALDPLELLSFVRAWFRLINDHAPKEKLLALLADDGFELRFPEIRLTNKTEFNDWYREITQQYFDQNHHVKQITIIDASATGTQLGVWVNWQAKSWTAPAAYSMSQDYDAFQRWQLVADGTGMPRIKRYIVEQLIDNRKPN